MGLRPGIVLVCSAFFHRVRGCDAFLDVLLLQVRRCLLLWSFTSSSSIILSHDQSAVLSSTQHFSMLYSGDCAPSPRPYLLTVRQYLSLSVCRGAHPVRMWPSRYKCKGWGTCPDISAWLKGLYTRLACLRPVLLCASPCFVPRLGCTLYSARLACYASSAVCFSGF